MRTYTNQKSAIKLNENIAELCRAEKQAIDLFYYLKRFGNLTDDEFQKKLSSIRRQYAKRINWLIWLYTYQTDLKVLAGLIILLCWFVFGFIL